MSNLGTDLSNSCLIVVKIKEKEYQF
ncbi:hypothetical protein CEW46_31840, partial [Bacillus cereus]